MGRVSIVIPALNEAQALPQLLQRLAPLRQEDCEIIVVDGGSDDGTVTVAQESADRVIVAPRGRALQMNAGAAQASGEILWFLHADTLPPSSCISLIRSAVRSEAAGWGRFDVQLSGRSVLLRVVESMMNWRSSVTGIATGDQAIFVRRDWFIRCGAFPEIALMEDIALSQRLKRLSRPIRLQETVKTSSRRWEKAGVLRTILLMWRLRLAYFLGADPRHLARVYRHG